MDFRVLGQCQGDRGRILGRAARDRRSRSEQCRAVGRRDVAARLLGVAERPLCLAARLLGARAAELGLGAGHYVWAPRGYVFVDGYWDYAIGRRGVLFAPVYFNADVYGRRGFSYSPSR